MPVNNLGQTKTRHNDGHDNGQHQKNNEYPIGNYLTKNHKLNWQTKQINE